MTRWTEYHTPLTVEAALNTLRESPDAAIIAGGTDLFLDLDQGRHAQVSSLIDISRIDSLLKVREERGYLVIGAAIPLARLVDNVQIAEHAPGLVEACNLIGGPQVRNVATLGGNVAHALPAGDGTIALLSLGAEACLISLESQRWVALSELFVGPGLVAFDRRSELISALRFKLRQSGEGSAFRRVMRPQGVAIAILNMAVWLRCDPEGTILDARISLGPGGQTPFISDQAQAVLYGHQPDPETIQLVAEAVLQEARFRTSPHRSTQAYRELLVSPLLEHTLVTAHQRACAYQIPLDS
jgi:CO/xanthine dehydrogenase FAD-binding subunit